MDYLLSLPYDEGLELINYAVEQENEKLYLINWLIGGYALQGVDLNTYKNILKEKRNPISADEVLIKVEKILDGMREVN